MRRVLELTGSDMYIPPAHIDDKMLTDPVAWLNARVAEVNGAAVEDNA